MVVEYYYSSEDIEADDVFECTYAGTVNGEIQDLTSMVQGTKYNYSYSGAYDNTDSAMHLTLSGGKLEDGQSMVIKTKMTKKNSRVSYEHGNDYSYKNPNGVCVYLNNMNILEMKESVKLLALFFFYKDKLNMLLTF